MTLSETKSPGWMRAVQIVLGIIAVVGSIIALFFPAITTFTVVYILGIVLIFVGIERILIGIFSPAPGSSRSGADRSWDYCPYSCRYCCGKSSRLYCILAVCTCYCTVL